MQDRRQYYRINDRVSLKYRVVQGFNVQEEISKSRKQYRDFADLRNTLRCIDARLDLISDQLVKESPLIGEMLSLINKKFALHEQMIGGNNNTDDHELSPAENVNLSASGIAFDTETPINVGTYLKLEIVTYPEHHYILVYAKVIKCSQQDANSVSGYIIAVEFESISEEDREKVVHHIFKKQSEEIKKNKQDNPAEVTTENSSMA